MELYENFLKNYNYDVRISRDARWIDQKCTYDVLSIIADCILEYTETEKEIFSISDIWHSNYARENVVAIFSKPDPRLKAKNEYDKYFGQPIKLLSYSKILIFVEKRGNANYYKINNKEILEQIALRPMNALNFLYDYITKVLKDSEVYGSFKTFFEKQDKNEYEKLRQEFIKFTITNTNINGETECGRIFTKIVNPLAFKLKKFGTEKGKISKKIITLADLQYNRFNWRDELTGKDKSKTRNEHEGEEIIRDTAFSKYIVSKAKKDVKKYNDRFYNSISEIKQPSETVKATQAHHIFPQSDYPFIAGYLENLIMLTPNQHYSMAHPNNKTQYIDKDFQYICLLAKLNRIRENLLSNELPKFYNFSDYKFVLNTGLETEAFSPIKDLDFSSVIEKIDFFYSDFIGTNKYESLKNENKMTY